MTLRATCLPAGCLTIVAVATGCVSLVANSSLFKEHLQLVSAGYTGCLPADNELSNVTTHANGDGLWNATCKGKTYLCTAAGSVGGSESFSCAPAVP